MLAQFAKLAKADVWTHEEHRLTLLAGHDDLVRRSDAVDICRTVTDDEIASVHHAKVNVKSRPKTVRDFCPVPRSGLTFFIGPAAPNIGRSFSFFTVLF